MSKLYPKLQIGGIVPNKSQKTKLTQGQQLAYEKWKSENKYNESDDYDLAGYWKEQGMKNLSFPNLSPIEKFKEIESKDFPQLDDFYKNNKNTAGMYHGEGTISRNLYSDRSPRALNKVMELEKMRGVLEENRNDPNLPKLNFKIRREDNNAFKTNKQYSIRENPESKNAIHYIDTNKKTRRETIASRVYIGDALLNQDTNSYVEPSNEQVIQTKRLSDYAHSKPYHLPDKFKRLAPFSNGDGYMLLSEESKYSGNPSYNLSDKNGNPLNTSFDKRGQGFWQGNQFIGYQSGGTLSQLGYKRHSPYNKAPSLLIHTPTGSITMKEVDHPILGIGHNEIKFMLPNKEYQFKSSKVLEIPMKSLYPKKYQEGGRSPKVYTDKKEFLKAKQMYDDSLTSYNWGQNSVRQVLNTGKSLSGKNIIDVRTQSYKSAKDEIRDKLQEYRRIDPTITQKDVEKDFYSIDKNGIHAKGVQRFYHADHPKDSPYKGYSDIHVYKKPNQPVIYQQQEQPRMSKMTPVQTIQPQIQDTLVQRPITMKTIYPSKPHVWNTTTPKRHSVERAPGLGGYNRIYQQGGQAPEMSQEQQQEIVRRVRNLRKTIGYNKVGSVPLDGIQFRHYMYVNKKKLQKEDEELLGAFDEDQMVKLMNEVPDENEIPMGQNGMQMPTSPHNRIIKDADKQIMLNVIKSAHKNRVDPYTAVSIGLQETGLLKSDKWSRDGLNPLHDNSTISDEGSLDRSMLFLKKKFDYAKQLGKTDEASQIQAWNGYGKMRPSVNQKSLATWALNNEDAFDKVMSSNKLDSLENAYRKPRDKMYGISFTKDNPLDFNKNPVYGKRILDIRENFVKKDIPTVNMINSIIGLGNSPGQYVLTKPNQTSVKLFKLGGKIGSKSKMYPKCKCGCGGVSVKGGMKFQQGGQTPKLKGDAKVAQYQAMMNRMLPGNAQIAVDGVWGKNTDAAFKLLKNELREDYAVSKYGENTSKKEVVREIPSVKKPLVNNQLNKTYQGKELPEVVINTEREVYKPLNTILSFKPIIQQPDNKPILDNTLTRTKDKVYLGEELSDIEISTPKKFYSSLNTIPYFRYTPPNNILKKGEDSFNIKDIRGDSLMEGSKDTPKKIEYIGVHHTGTDNLKQALDHSKSSNEGYHFLIDKDGTIVNVMDTRMRTNHWGGDKNPNNVHKTAKNSNSIGISYVSKKGEITKEQELSGSKLLQKLSKENSIKLENILGHGDVSKKGHRIDTEGYPLINAYRKQVKFQQGGTMDVLDEDGNSQMTIVGGERIFSRVATSKMLMLNEGGKMFELGKFVCDELSAQEKRKPQYVKE